MMDVGPNGSSNSPTEGGSDLERTLEMIEGVRGARVVGAPERIREVHVLAGNDRAAKQIVRDVQSVMLTKFGIEIDYRAISVAQLDVPASAEETPQPGARPRTVVARVTVSLEGSRANASVALERDGQTFEGATSGAATTLSKMVAQATVEAVSHTATVPIDVEVADLITAGQFQVALTILRIATPRQEQIVSGAAVVRRDANEAVARAVLDALNRFLDSV